MRSELPQEIVWGGQNEIIYNNTYSTPFLSWQLSVLSLVLSTLDPHPKEKAGKTLKYLTVTTDGGQGSRMGGGPQGLSSPCSFVSLRPGPWEEVDLLCDQEEGKVF